MSITVEVERDTQRICDSSTFCLCVGHPNEWDECCCASHLTEGDTCPVCGAKLVLIYFDTGEPVDLSPPDDVTVRRPS